MDFSLLLIRPSALVETVENMNEQIKECEAQKWKAEKKANIKD